MDVDWPVAQPLFVGVAVALVSLFDGERLLVKDTALHGARVAAEGARAIVLAGSTGEPWLLTAEERAALTEATRTLVPDVPVIVGTGHPDTAEAVRLTASAREAGADAVIAISPPGSEDLVGYYKAVAAAAGDLPVLAYHFPKVSSPGISVEMLRRLPVCAVKDSSGDAERLASELQAWQGPVYVGSPLLLAAAGSFGARGAILALANLEIERCHRAFHGDLDAQRDLVPDHLAAQEDFPRGLKRMLAARHGTPVGSRVHQPSQGVYPAARRMRVSAE
jgi:4-hydroxy-tetrahydrodipicolinate synthase